VLLGQGDLGGYGGLGIYLRLGDTRKEYKILARKPLGKMPSRKTEKEIRE
jgi:hypothetical protein